MKTQDEATQLFSYHQKARADNESETSPYLSGLLAGSYMAYAKGTYYAKAFGEHLRYQGVLQNDPQFATGYKKGYSDFERQASN
jgi:hypothetical protein